MGKRLPVRYVRRGQAASPEQPSRVHVKVNGRHDLEQVCFAVQTLIARLQDQDVYALEDLSIYCAPVNAQGERMLLKDAKGKPIELLPITLPVAMKFSRAQGR
jgi:hypothetical protein